MTIPEQLNLQDEDRSGRPNFFAVDQLTTEVDTLTDLWADPRMDGKHDMFEHTKSEVASISIRKIFDGMVTSRVDKLMGQEWNINILLDGETYSSVYTTTSSVHDEGVIAFNRWTKELAAKRLFVAMIRGLNLKE
jgi:hypothetical protein